MRPNATGEPGAGLSRRLRVGAFPRVLVSVSHRRGLHPQHLLLRSVDAARAAPGGAPAAVDGAVLRAEPVQSLAADGPGSTRARCTAVAHACGAGAAPG